MCLDYDVNMYDNNETTTTTTTRVVPYVVAEAIRYLNQNSHETSVTACGKQRVTTRSACAWQATNVRLKI